MRYIVLHELAHRQMHGGSHSFHDEVVDRVRGARPRKLEQDAEGYALEQFGGCTKSKMRNELCTKSLSDSSIWNRKNSTKSNEWQA